MNGRAGWRTIAAAGLAAMLVVSACQSSDEAALPPEDAAVDDSTTSSSSTTATTATSSTETTLSELAEAEAAIEAAIVGWWTFPSDTSLGEEGQPFEYVTGALFHRLRSLNERRTAAGEIQRSQGNPQVRILQIRTDLESGSAEVDLCTQGNDELVDAATGEVLAQDFDEAFTGNAMVERVAGTWKVADFFTTQSGDDPIACEVG